MKNWIIQVIKDLISKYKILEKWYGIRVETKEFYGQFGEDASLQSYFANQAWNSTKDAREINKGFYVDIGCYSPIRISNTYWFYKRGWRGINVDLSHTTIEAFKAARPEDIHVNAAISNETTKTELDFFEFGASSVFNTLDAESAAKTEKKIGTKPIARKVDVLTLEKLFDTYLPENQKISFINVDAEGHDLEVLMSNNWLKYKPQVIVVEVHEPDFQMLPKHPVFVFLQSHGYQIQSWLNPSIIFSLASGNYD
jgi:FkbM family methyltransferase